MHPSSPLNIHQSHVKHFAHNLLHNYITTKQNLNPNQIRTYKESKIFIPTFTTLLWPSKQVKVIETGMIGQKTQMEVNYYHARKPLRNSKHCGFRHRRSDRFTLIMIHRLLFDASQNFIPGTSTTGGSGIVYLRTRVHTVLYTVEEWVHT